MNQAQRRDWHNSVIAHHELTPSAKVVLLALETYVDYDNGCNAHPGIDQLAKSCALGRTAVKDALAAGRRLRLIEQTSRANPKAGLAAVYRLVSIAATPALEPDFNGRDDGSRNGFQGPDSEFQGPDSSVSRAAHAAPTTSSPPPKHHQPITLRLNSHLDADASAAHDAIYEIATSERGNGLSPPVSVGAVRLVAAIIGDKVDNAAKTMLRLKTNQLLCEGRSDDDVTDCLRIWLTKPHLGAAGLSLCMTEVDKRKLTRTELSTSEKNFIKAQALKARMSGNTRKELHQ